jgi:hypothetical protein
MSTITRSWKRILAVGCSHGEHICPDARRAVLKFIREYKPATVVHLGDFCDTTAFRSGAHGTKDEAEPVAPDIESGLTFLAEIGATHVLLGNHEDRLFSLARSPNAIVSYAAGKCIGAIEDHCRKIRAKFYPWDGAFQGLKLGNFTFLHGYMYGENATRDHAEAHGNVVHAHNHRPALATGRRSDAPLGFAVGTLTRRREMGYAKARRATLSWGQAIVYGEYTDQLCQLNLILGPQEQAGGTWRLP